MERSPTRCSKDLDKPIWSKDFKNRMFWGVAKAVLSTSYAKPPTVPGLVLSLVVEKADAIQEAFKFTRPGPVLLFALQLFHRVDGTIRFPLLVVALG
jgi:hypothetical protein